MNHRIHEGFQLFSKSILHIYIYWKKVQIENMNKLFRQCMPKSEIINQHNTLNLKNIQVKTNNRLG